MVQAVSRRDRVRAATSDEIKETARRILVAEGPEAISLRKIAGQMGMTAPALYRYFGSREDLIRHVVGDIFSEIAGDVRRHDAERPRFFRQPLRQCLHRILCFERKAAGHHFIRDDSE